MNSKNTIRLTESELKQIITESVRNILKENNSFHGIPNAEVNVDEDGEKVLLWNGHEMDYWEVENYLYRDYEYEMEDLNQSESEEGFEMWLNTKGEKYITDVLKSLFWPQGAGYVTESKAPKIRFTESKLKQIITESVKNILKESEGDLLWDASGVQNELVEVSRIAHYLVNDYLDVIPQEQLDNLGDMTQKYRQFLSMFIKQIDSKRW